MSNIGGIHVRQVPSSYGNFDVLEAAQTHLMRVFNPESPPQVINENLRSMVADGNTDLILAIRADSLDTSSDWDQLDAEQFVGTLSLMRFVTSTRTVGYIDHLAVDPDYRRRGIAESIARKALEVGTERGVTRFDLTSGAGKVAAHKLWQKVGFTRRNTNNWRYEI